MVTAYKESARAPREWAVVIVGIGGLALAVAMIIIAEQRGWPSALLPIFFASGWATLLGSWVVARRRERKLRAKYQLLCPSCAAPLVDRSLVAAQVAIATGNCPRCGANILAP